MRLGFSHLPILIFIFAELALLGALLARKDGEPMVRDAFARGRLGIALSLLTGGAVCGALNYVLPAQQVLGIAVGAIVSALGALVASSDWTALPLEPERLSTARRDVMISLVLLFMAALAAGIVAITLSSD